jgi:CubicO group peptidase (beta-lactamase class C family)
MVARTTGSLEEALAMDTGGIDRLLERAVSDRVVPGVVAVVGDRDEALYEGAFGRLRVDGDTPVRPDSMIWIASMTKAIVSVAALQLIEQGRLELEQPVADVLPAFGELQVLEGFDGDTPRLRPPTRQATIANLFTHTAGPGYWFANADALRYHQVTGVPDPTAGRLAVLLEMPLVADPGTRWEYGTSTDWVGQVIEAISGRDLATYCEEKIFHPLGMADATFRPTDEQRARMMPVHSRTPDGGLVPTPLDLPAEPEFWSGGGGGYATAPDYLRFMRALLRGGELDGERILRPDTVELAFTDHLAGVGMPAVVRSVVPEVSNDIEFLPVSQGWGLGFHLVLEDIPGMRNAGTGDWAGLSNCYFWIDRAAGVAGAFLTQVLPFFDARIVETATGFEQAVYAGLGAPAVTQ